MTGTEVISLAAVLIAALALLLSQLNTARSIRREANLRDESLRQRVSAIEIKVDVFWTGLMKDAAVILHQETEIERDVLLEKLLADDINAEEIQELRVMLKAEINKPDQARDMGPKIAAAVLLNLLDSHATLHVEGT